MRRFYTDVLTLVHIGAYTRVGFRGFDASVNATLPVVPVPPPAARRFRPELAMLLPVGPSVDELWRLLGSHAMSQMPVGPPTDPTARHMASHVTGGAPVGPDTTPTPRRFVVLGAVSFDIRKSSDLLIHGMTPSDVLGPVPRDESTLSRTRY